MSSCLHNFYTNNVLSCVGMNHVKGHPDLRTSLCHNVSNLRNKVVTLLSVITKYIRCGKNAKEIICVTLN